MGILFPWSQLEEIIEPFYQKAGNGRKHYPLIMMLRVHCKQLSYNLSDPTMEDSRYEIESMRRFAGILISDPLPDETTILKFRHWLEKYELGNQLFNEISKHLESKGLRLKVGTIVDASIISAPK